MDACRPTPVTKKSPPQRLLIDYLRELLHRRTGVYQSFIIYQDRHVTNLNATAGADARPAASGDVPGSDILDLYIEELRRTPVLSAQGQKITAWLFSIISSSLNLWITKS